MDILAEAGPLLAEVRAEGRRVERARVEGEPVDALQRRAADWIRPRDLLDLVAEELDADGVVGGGREHVEDAAAHLELATTGDHVDPRVG